MGFDLNLNADGNQTIDVMAWIGVVILVDAGFQLLRFHPSGRYWALFVFWVLLLEQGGLVIWMIILWIRGLSKGKSPDLGVNFNSPIWHGEIKGLFAVALYFSVVFIFFFIPTYFLMRKDVKQLFDKAGTTETSAPNSEATPS